MNHVRVFVNRIVTLVCKIINHIEKILKYLKVFDNACKDDGKILLYFVIDGLPPLRKHRKYCCDKDDNEIKNAYSKMITEDKDVLHVKIIKIKTKGKIM